MDEEDELEFISAPVPPPKTNIICINDKRQAIKISYKNGGVPLCWECWRKDDRFKTTLQGTSAGKKLKAGGSRGVFLPKSIVEMYESAYVDSELVSVREDIATCEARIRQLYKQIKTNPKDSSQWATVFSKTLQKQRAAIAKGSLSYAEAFRNIEEFMESPAKDSLIYAEIYQVSELKRKLVATESKRLNDLGWTPEMVMAMIAEIADILKPMMSEVNMRVFMDHLATSKLFNNQQFRFLDQVNLTAMSVDQQLLAQEMEAKAPKLIETSVKDGVHTPVE